MADWIKKAMGPGWQWRNNDTDEMVPYGSKEPRMLELTPRETFRMWAEDWAKEEPARPSIGLAEHGIHMPHLDRCLYEHVVLPRSLEKRVPVYSTGTSNNRERDHTLDHDYEHGLNDEALKRDTPHHGLVWPAVPLTEHLDDATMESQVFLVFSSESLAVLQLWADAAIEAMQEEKEGILSCVNVWSLELFDTYYYGTGQRKPNVVPQYFSVDEILLIHVRPEDCSYHAPLRDLVNALRRRCASFYVRVPPRPDRLRFLRHLNTQLARPGGHLAYLLPDGSHSLLDDTVIREIAANTSFFHYSDIARLFLRTVEQWQRDLLCRRQTEISLSTRMCLIFCRGDERNPKQLALQEERQEETKNLDRFFALPVLMPHHGGRHDLLLSDVLNVVELMDQEVVAQAHAMEAVNEAKSKGTRKKEQEKRDSAGDKESEQRPKKRQRIEESPMSLATKEPRPFPLPVPFLSPRKREEGDTKESTGLTFTFGGGGSGDGGDGQVPRHRNEQSNAHF